MKPRKKVIKPGVPADVPVEDSTVDFPIEEGLVEGEQDLGLLQIPVET